MGTAVAIGISGAVGAVGAVGAGLTGQRVVRRATVTGIAVAVTIRVELVRVGLEGAVVVLVRATVGIGILNPDPGVAAVA